MLRITPEEIKELRELEAKATAGPWTYEILSEWADDPNYSIAQVPEPLVCETSDGDYLSEPNAKFISAARNALPKLLDEIERLQKELEVERMRLAGCSTAALGYFDGCAEEYKSASLSDVLSLRERWEAVNRKFALLRGLARSAENLIVASGLRHCPAKASEEKDLIEALDRVKEGGAWEGE